jgi:hypothetical protein
MFMRLGKQVSLLTQTLSSSLNNRKTMGLSTYEDGSGRPIVLNYPLHIAMFEHNFRRYRPPHEQFMATGNGLLPPVSYTPQYLHRLDTVLVHSHGPTCSPKGHTEEVYTVIWSHGRILV